MTKTQHSPLKTQDSSASNNSDLKVAIVCDWLVGGGAEKVVLELHKMYPDAPIYASFATDEWKSLLNNKVVTGYLQKWPFSKLRKFLPVLRQSWFRNLNLAKYDLVISCSGNGEAKFVWSRAGAKHVCYCNTPPHFYWQKYQEYLENPGFRPYWLVRLALKILVAPLRKRDYQAAQSVDYFVANSSHIQSAIKTYYDRESVVVHPPVDLERFNPPAQNSKLKTQNYYITVGRQTPYKRTDIIVEACTQLNLPLLVVGNGPENEHLQQIAGPNVKFYTNADNDTVSNLLANAKAFLFAAVEDFGISPVEAMASGTPVIALKAGGALDYVTPGKTGEFFTEQTVESLVTALKSFKPTDYSPDDIKRSAQAFSKDIFAQNMHAQIQKVLN